MSKVKLPNRYGDDIWLEPIEENVYAIRENGDMLKYMRFGYDKMPNGEMKIMFIDPSGGPFISVDNFSINDKVVKEIRKNDDEFYLVTE